MLHKNKRVVASAILAMAISTDAAFSNVKITQFQQSGLDLSFLVSWTTAESRASDSHSEVDIWLQTRGPDPSSFMETVLQQGIENTSSIWIDAGDSWAARSSWDSAKSGEAIVCVYNSSNPFDNACAEALGILPEAEAPSAVPGDGISNVDVLHVDQNGSSLEFSVSWADGGGDGGLEDLALFVDLWVVAQQSDPSAWVELPVAQNVENERLSHLEVDMDWSFMGWDVTRGGQLQSCVYDSQDYDNYACSDFVAFTASDEEFDDSDKNGSTGEGGEGGTVLALVVTGALIIGLVGWLAVSSSRRRQRRRWLGHVNDAEALPEDIFIRPPEAYSGFQ